jgi:hypothetical protein
VLHLRLSPFTTPEQPVQRLSVEANGLPLGDWEFRHVAAGDVVPISLAIPANRIPEDGRIWLRLSLPDAVAPAAVAQSDDRRELGVSLIDVRAEPAPAEPTT